MALSQKVPKKIYLRVNEIIHVTGVSLNKNSIVLTTAGQTAQLTATVTPSDADDTSVTWSSSDTSIATVSSTGLVTCVTPGTATITVTTTDGGYTDTCSVTSQPIWTLSTDLTQYTSVSQLQALGWTGIAQFNAGSYTMANGNGIEINPSSNYVVSLYYYLNTPLTTSNKLTLHWQGMGKNGSYSGVTDGALCISTGDAAYTGNRLAFYVNDTGIRVNGDMTTANLNMGWGTFDLTATMDFSTGVITYIGTSQYGIQTINQSRTMTASEISNTLNYRYIIFQIVSYGGAGRGNYLSKAEFLIE